MKLIIRNSQAATLIIAILAITGIAATVGIIESPIFGTSATFNYSTASTVPYFDADKKLISSAVTPTQLGYMTSATGNFGTSAFLTAGTSANNLVQLNGSAQLPAVDGSLLTGITSGSGKLIVENSGYGLDNGSTERGVVGENAVSLEIADGGGSNYGATGANSFSVGDNTKASGSSSTATGYANIASGQSSSALGGSQNTVSGTSAGIFGGAINIATGNYSVCLGGLAAHSSHYGEIALSSGRFLVETGSCQRGSVQFRLVTSSVSQSEMFLDGGDPTGERFTLSDGDSYSCKITVLGKMADGSCGTAVYRTLVKMEGTTTSLTSTVQTLETWFGDTNIGTPTWTIEADDTNDALVVKITPANTTATRWTAVLEYVKINY